MKRLCEWMGNGVVAFSLLACVLTAGMWVRSYRVVDIFEHWSAVNAAHDFTDEMASSHSGWLLFRYWTVHNPMGWAPDSALSRYQTWRPRSGEAASFRQFVNAFYTSWALGVRHYTDTYNFSREGFTSLEIDRNAAIPYWMVVGFSAALPLLRAIRWRRARRRIGISLCHDCGYDLRATPDRCPECGTVPAKAQISV